MASPAMTLTTAALPAQPLAYTNCLFVNPGDMDKLAAAAREDPAKAAKGMLCAVGQAVFVVKPRADVKVGTIAVGSIQRGAGMMGVDAPVPVSPFFPPRDRFPLAQITVEISPWDMSAAAEIDAAELAIYLQQEFANHVFKPDQPFVTVYRPSSPQQTLLRCTVRGFEYIEMTEGSGAGASAGGAGGLRFGQFLKTTSVKLQKHPNAANTKITGSSSGRANKLIDKGFNFEEMGVGGLGEQFKSIFRRAFASRLVPPDILRKMGQHHIRGMLLFGPPGCGKTLIARQIGKALHSRPPKIVNGPEIMNKFVGQSEENIRKLFEDAEKEQAEKGDDSELHIIIFDEIDAIVRQRGTTGGGTGVNDSVVNQLLSKIDGVDSLNNILIIGMTNRKDMIDEAVLRPGRLELHVEIGLPDEEGRIQILAIHTAELRKNGFLGADVSIPDVAARTRNYTGAEIEAVVKAACSYVFSRQVDINDPTKVKDFGGVTVTAEDFDRALREVKPAFGVQEEALTQCFSNGIIHTGEDFERVYVTLQRLAAQVLHSETSPLVSVMLTGPASSGKSALAAKIAHESGFPFIKRISGETLVNMHEAGRADHLVRVFNDAYKSPVSMIILDDIERIVQYVALGLRFCNPALQALLVLIKALPPPGHRLFIVGTTAQAAALEPLEIMSTFQLQLAIPELEREEEYAAVFRSTGCMAPADAATCAAQLAGKPMGIKKLLNIVEMSRQAGDAADAPITAAHFLEAMVEWGI